MFGWCQQPTLSNEKARLAVASDINSHLSEKARRPKPPTRRYIQLCNRTSKSRSREFGIQASEKDFEKPKSCITFHSVSAFRQRGVQTEAKLMPSSAHTKATHSKINLFSPSQFKEPSFQSSRHHKKETRMQWSTNIHFDHGFIDQSIKRRFPPKKHSQGIESQHYRVSEECYQQQKPTSQFYLTPNRMKLLLEKDTVVSRESSDEEQVSFRVEESVILQPEMRSKFLVLTTHPTANKLITIQQAFEQQIKLLVTVKEVPLSCLNNIREESRIYQEMESRRCKVSGVLALYQTYIHKQSCLLIKEPFFKTFSMHLLQTPFSQRIIVIQNCLAEIYATINAMREDGFGLCQQICVEDIVFSLNGFFIQNVRVFSIDAKCSTDIFFALYILKGEMIALSNKFTQ